MAPFGSPGKEEPALVRLPEAHNHWSELGAAGAAFTLAQDLLQWVQDLNLRVCECCEVSTEVLQFFSCDAKVCSA